MKAAIVIELDRDEADLIARALHFTAVPDVVEDFTTDQRAMLRVYATRIDLVLIDGGAPR